LAEEYGKHRATEFNVGVGKERRGTGVRYADVAGIDHVKADIDAMMSAVLGKGGYDDMGVRPPRARAPPAARWPLSLYTVHAAALPAASAAAHASQWMPCSGGTLRHCGARCCTSSGCCSSLLRGMVLQPLRQRLATPDATCWARL